MVHQVAAEASVAPLSWPAARVAGVPPRHALGAHGPFEHVPANNAGASVVCSTVLRPREVSLTVFLAGHGRWGRLIAGVRASQPAGGVVVWICASFISRAVFPWPVSLGGRNRVPVVRVVVFPRAWLARAPARALLAP